MNNYPILSKIVKESKEFPLFIYPRDKLCSVRFSRSHMEATNMREVEDIVFVNYFMFISRSEYFKQLQYIPHTLQKMN